MMEKSIALLLVVLMVAQATGNLQMTGFSDLSFKRPNLHSEQAAAKAVRGQMQLQFVVEVFRHGARYPVGDQFWNAPEQRTVSGELSPTGMRQHYTLGQMLRQEYVDERKFLPPTYNHTSIRVFSTDVNRTLMSAYSQLQGLYPATQGPLIPSTLIDYDLLLPAYKGVQSVPELGNYSLPQLMQVLPVHTLPGVENEVLSPWSNCSSLDYFENLFFALHPQWVQDVNTKYAKTYQQFNQIFKPLGQPTVGFSNVDDVYDVLIADAFNGYPLPRQMTPQLWQNVTELDTLIWFGQYGWSQNVSRIMNSHLLAQIQALMNNSVTGKNKNLNLSLFSGHDTNIANLMYALNISNLQCVSDYLLGGVNPFQPGQNCYQRPQFAANIILELYNGAQTPSTNPQDFYVMVRYNGEYVYVCDSAQMVCPYTEFIQRLQPTIISEQQWIQLCEYKPPSGLDYFKNIQNSISNPAVTSAVTPSQQESDSWILKTAVVAESVLLVSLAFYAFRTWKKNKDY